MSAAKTGVSVLNAWPTTTFILSRLASKSSIVPKACSRNAGTFTMIGGALNCLGIHRQRSSVSSICRMRWGKDRLSEAAVEPPMTPSTAKPWRAWKWRTPCTRSSEYTLSSFATGAIESTMSPSAMSRRRSWAAPTYDPPGFSRRGNGGSGSNPESRASPRYFASARLRSQ